MGGVSAYHSATIGASSCSSLSIRSEDSDFEFGCCDSASEDPPVSPSLHRSSPRWESSASSYTVSSAPSSTTRATNFAAPAVHAIAALQQGQPADASGEDSSQSIKFWRSYDATNGRHDATPAGAGLIDISGLPYEDAAGIGRAGKNTLRSQMLQRRELDDLPPLASVRSSTVPQRSARTSARSSPSSHSANASPSAQESHRQGHFDSQHAKEGRKWLFGMDFLHSKKESSPNSHNNRHHVGDMKSDSCSYTSETSRQSISSSSSVAAPFKSDSKCIIDNGSQGSGQSMNAMYCGYGPVSPSTSPSRTLAAHQQRSAAPSAGYGHSTPPSSPHRPRSPHAQHYQEQRARKQELGRRTLLPYRQSFLGSCFFPSPVASH